MKGGEPAVGEFVEIFLASGTRVHAAGWCDGVILRAEAGELDIHVPDGTVFRVPRADEGRGWRYRADSIDARVVKLEAQIAKLDEKLDRFMKPITPHVHRGPIFDAHPPSPAAIAEIQRRELIAIARIVVRDGIMVKNMDGSVGRFFDASKVPAGTLVYFAATEEEIA